MKRFSYITVLTVVAVGGASCTVHQTETPSLSGPSDLAYSVTATANPDTVSYDDGSTSVVTIEMHGPDGKPVQNQEFRVDMVVGGQVQDFGRLSARSVATNASGKATVQYISPGQPSGGSAATCNGLPGVCVTIVATPTGPPAATDTGTAFSTRTTVRLVPLGVILPPAGTPTPAFTITPTPVNFNIASTFDASTSCGSALVSGTCPNSSAITSFAWTFGDGGSATGRTVNHTFTSSTQASTTFNVTLTVTNDRGVSASTTQQVQVGASPAPTGDFVFSPVTPLPNQVVVFNADSVRASAGHTITQISWIFGDGGVGTGFLTSHTFLAPGSYSVTMSAVDEVGQKLTVAKTVPVGSSTGLPQANFVISPDSPVSRNTNVNFDATRSTAPNGASIIAYQWQFECVATGCVGTEPVTTTSTPTVTHTYANAGTFTVKLTVIDSASRTGTLTRLITVQ